MQFLGMLERLCYWEYSAVVCVRILKKLCPDLLCRGRGATETQCGASGSLRGSTVSLAWSFYCFQFMPHKVLPLLNGEGASFHHALY